jgi:hypothetical protein
MDLIPQADRDKRNEQNYRFWILDFGFWILDCIDGMMAIALGRSPSSNTKSKAVSLSNADTRYINQYINQCIVLARTRPECPIRFKIQNSKFKIW